jgi:hypothetical protein
MRQGCKYHDPQAQKDTIQDKKNKYLQVIIVVRLIEMLIDRIVAYFIPQKMEFNGHNFFGSQWRSRPEPFWPPYLAYWQKVQKPAGQCPYCHICLVSDNPKDPKEHFL